MNKYIYIGTEQELIKHGFRIVDDRDIKAIRRNKNRVSNTFIEHTNLIVSWGNEHFKDLIEAKLVKEILG